MKDELLVKYLTDNCTEAELQEVELWLDGSVEHQNRLDELVQSERCCILLFVL